MIKKTSEAYKHNLSSFIIGPTLKIIEAFFDLLIPLIMKTVIDLMKFSNVEAIPNALSRFLANFIRMFGTWVKDNQALSDSLVALTIILIMGIVGYALTMISQYLAAKSAINVGTEVRDSLFKKISSLSKKDKEKIGSARLQTVLNSDTYQLQQGVLIFIRLIVRAPFIIIGALIFSFILDWKIGFVFLAIIPLILVVVFLIMGRSSKKYVAIQKNLDDISLKTSDTIEGSKVIRAFAKQNDENVAFDNVAISYKKKAINVNKWNSFINPLTFAIISIATILVAVFGGLPIIDSSSAEAIMLATTIVAEVSYLAQISFTLMQLTNVVLIITKANVSKRRIDEVLAIKPSIINKESPLKKEIKDNEELIRFDNVSLKYEDDGNYALKNISFSLNKGQSLGIIGGTGSGKSTILSLINRFIDPSEGNIYYKGINLRDYDLKALRDDIALVMQKSSLFKGTIKDNLLMGKADASDKDIKSALENALAYDFVKEYKDYINHEVNENGTNFSGGQRQRLCIARALLKNSELLILDDSTSALDLLTDKKVRENITNNYQNLTKIYISQRVSTICDSDLILVMDGGRLIDSGTHDYLKENCPIYNEFILSQMKGGTK